MAFQIRFILGLALLLAGTGLFFLYLLVLRPILGLVGRMENFQQNDMGFRISKSYLHPVGALEAYFSLLINRVQDMSGNHRDLDQLKADFVSTVSHELRTPLTSIGGYVKLLAGGDAGPVTETQKEFLKIVDINVNRLTHLINDVLDIEAMEGKKIELVREPQSLSPILRECADTFLVLAEEKGLEIKFRVPEHIFPILGDRNRLVQIFMNLLSNSIKYTKKGFIEIVAEQNDIAVTVRVRDTGVGLKPEEIKKLFQKFYRAEASETAEGGSGLGLAIAKTLVEAHDGNISVESQPGIGSQFTVIFPRIANDTILSKTDSAVLSKEASKVVKEVWLIERNSRDQEQILASLKSLETSFPEYQFNVTRFSQPSEMPEVSKLADAPSLVVVQSSIAETAKKIHQKAPILAIGSLIDPGEAFSEGATAVLTKQMGPAEFNIAIRELIATKSCRTLIVDHHTDFRILLKRELEQKGIHVDDFGQGHLILSRLEHEKYDLILLDPHLPDIQGTDLFQVIRRNETLKETAVFFLSEGNEDFSFLHRSELGGVNQVVHKKEGIQGIVKNVLGFLEARSQ